MRTFLALAVLSLASTALAQVKFSSATYGAGQSPNSVTTGDFNRDGRPDFAVMEAGNQLTIFLNTGSGNFTQKAQYAVVTNDNNARIDTADMNNDGILDLVIGKQFTPEFEIWYGKGDGTFTFGKDVPTDLPDVYDFRLADIDHNGYIDLIARSDGDTSSTFETYFNDRSGNFTPRFALAIAPIPNAWVVGDFDGDGKLDLVLYAANSFIHFKGDNAGNFAQGNFSPAPKKQAGAPASLVVGSFNHDSRLDLALLQDTCTTCNASSRNKASIYLNDGKANFGLRASYTVGYGQGEIVAGDLNGDGIQDLVVTGSDLVNGNAVPMQYLLNAGDAHFSGPFSLGNYSRQAAPVIRDLNLDGRHDVVALAGSTFRLLNQNASVTCAPPASANLSARICGPSNNGTVSKTFTVSASGNSPLGVARLELWIDGKKAGEIWNDQLRQSVTVSAGKHRVAIVAVDRYLSKTVTSAVSVTAH